MTEDLLTNLSRRLAEIERRLGIDQGPVPYPNPVPWNPLDSLRAYPQCPSSCKPGEPCGNAACPLRLPVTCRSGGYGPTTVWGS